MGSTSMSHNFNTTALNTTALNSLLQEAVDSGIPGVSVAIANSESLLWSGVAGKADIITNAPVQADHLFGIGSITKTFVAVIILQLVEEGSLSLDKTAVDILGDEVAGRVPNAELATIAQLLNHTGGIPSWEDDPLWVKEGRGAEQQVNRLWTPEQTLPYIEHSPVMNAAGEKYAYANTNHTLLGLIIEKVTGNKIVDVIHQRILKPLNLSDIYLEGFQAVPSERLSKRYHYSTPEFKSNAGIHSSFPEVREGLIDVSTSNLSVEWAAGGMVATASDLARYAAALQAGQLLQPQSMSFVKDWFPIKQDQEIGHGVFRVRTQAGYNLLGHMGAVLGYTASMQWFEDKDLAMVVLANVGTMHIGQSLPNAATLAYQEKFLALVSAA